jgi:hypothetical protein
MCADIAEKSASSWFERLMGTPRSLWVTVGIGLLLTLLPLIAAYLDGVLAELLTNVGSLRFLFLAPAVILYILIIAPVMARADARVLEAFRPLVQLDDDSFERVVERASHINPRAQLLAFGLGAAFGLLLGHTWLTDTEAFWLKLYIPLSVALMFGLLAWVIFASVAGTRRTAELHRQPLRFDIFDLEAFEPIGRQSLLIGLVFVGGIALSMIFSVGRESFTDWRNWIVYAVLALVPFLLFFLNMRDTHRVLAAEKERELEAVQRTILWACRTLVERIDAAQDTGTLGAEINALVAYENRLQGSRTWPYNTAMIRVLFFSLIIPATVELVKLVSENVLK